MAAGDSLLKLFKSFKENDQVEFTKVAYEIIEEEKRKNHYLLANKLHKILFDENFTVSINKNKMMNYKQIPTDKESGFQLMEMKFAKVLLNEVILSELNKEKVLRIINEFENKELLKSYKLSPKTKILFCGPPGCGKTITVEAISNELQVPLLYTRFDSVISSYLGETATNLRKVFDFAKEGEWILFFDEFDSIGKSRDNTSEHGELKRVVNSFLQLMDNFSKESIIIAATNYENLIDKALWRRFDEIIYFDMPNAEEIRSIVKSKLRNYSHKKLNIDKFMEELIGFSFADIERICLESIKQAILSGQLSIDEKLFKEVLAREKDRQRLVNRASE